MTNEEILALLEDARRVRHTVITTGGVTKLREGDRWIENKGPSLSDLDEYILQLERQLGLDPAFPRIRSRPVYF